LSRVSRSRRGISPILATLLLIVIAVAAVIVTYAWVMTFTMTQTEQAGAILIKENVRYYSVDSTKNMTEFTLRNTGTDAGKIVAIYWSKSSFSATSKLVSTEYTMFPETGVVNAGSSILITIRWGVSGGSITDAEWVSGTTYYYKFVTEAGQNYEYTEKAP
jgi:flagellin-like protein